MRESTKTELYYEDLEKLPVDEVARISEWLTEKVRSGGRSSWRGVGTDAWCWATRSA